MTHTILRWLWLLLVAALLATTTISGVRDASHNFPLAETLLQRVFVPIQFAYALAGIVALVALATRRRWSPWAVAAWGGGVTAAATLAPPAWGGTGLGPALAAGGATVVVCGLLVWGQAWFVRSEKRPATDTPASPDTT